MTHRNRNLLIYLCLVCIAGGLSHAQESNITSLIKQLEHNDVAVQNQARKQLVEMGEKAIPQLMENALRANHLKVLKNDDPPPFVRVNPKKIATVQMSRTIQYNCANALIEMGKTAVSSLIEALSDDDVYYRENASKLLALIGTPALPPIIAALDHELTFVRELALDTLNHMMLSAVPESRESSKRLLTLKAQPPQKDIFRGFIKALNDTDKMVRSLAIFHVGEHSKVSPESISTLTRFLYYGSPTYDKHTAWVLLHAVADEEGRAVLTKALDARQWALRFGVALAYADLFVQGRYVAHTKEGSEIGPLPKSVIPMLAEGLEHPDKEARAQASQALWTLSDHKVDDARKNLAAFPPLAIIDGTIKDEDLVYNLPLTEEPEPTIDTLNTEGITFKFNHFFTGGTVTIQTFAGELLDWNVQRHRKSVTITPPKGKELGIGVYIIRLSGFEDVARNQVNTKITFATAVRPL